MSSSSPTGAASSTPARSFLMRHIWVVAALLGVASLTILRTCEPRGLVPLQSLGPAPAFALQDQHGQSFSSTALQGKVWVGSFFFTSCKTVCPAIGKANQELQQKLAGTDVQLVSFSVDPEFDTPAAMTTWGAQFGADPNRWHLLTGPRKDIEAVVVGLSSHMGVREEKAGIVDIAHSMRLILVDPTGQILHHFRIDDPTHLGLIVDYAKFLEAEHQKRTGGSK